jgi:hypothetical protein
VIVASLFGTATFEPSSAPQLTATLQLDTDAESSLALDLELDLSVPQEIAGPGVQRCGYLIKLDDGVIAAHEWVSCGVSMDIGNFTPRWTAEMPLPSPFGSIAEHRGAPPGLRRVSIYGVYVTGTGIHLIPLVTDGQVDSAPHYMRDGQKMAAYEGGGSALRYDRRVVEYSRPPGHGLNRGVVAAEVARLAGWTRVSIAAGGRMDKEFLVTAEDDWTDRCAELLQTDGLTLLEDGAGNLVSVVDGYDPGRPVDLVLSLVDIGPDVDPVSASGDILTRVTVTGAAQVIREDCERHTVSQKVTSFAPYAPKTALFVQNSVGFGTTGLTQPTATLRKVSEVETLTEYECDTPVAERVFSRGWANPLAVRYEQQADGSRVKAAPTVYLYEGATEGDDAMAFEWQQERFVLTGYQETRHFFDERGFRAQTVTRKATPLFQKASLKERSDTGVAWDLADFSFPRLLLGNGSGVWNGSAADPRRFFERMPNLSPTHGLVPGRETEIEVVDYEVTDSGYKLGEVRRRSTFFAPAGSLYQYAGEDGRGIEIEEFGEYEFEAVAYVAALGDTSHTRVRSLFREGQLAEGPIIEEGLEGYLPAAERRLDIAPPADSFDTEEQAEAAVAASRYETAEIGAEVIDWTLEALRGRNEAPAVAARWAETEEECHAIGQRIIREGAAVSLGITLAGANFLIRPGWRLQIVGIADLIFAAAVSPYEPVDLYVRSVGWPMAGPDGPITTEVSGRAYLS